MTRTCNNCSSEALSPLFDLGELPIAHELLQTPDQPQQHHRVALLICDRCGLVQLEEPIDPAILYGRYNYCFSSWKPQPHSEDELGTVFSIAGSGPLFEVGCNDGLFLGEARKRGFAALSGLEPNPAAAAAAREKGLSIYESYLTPEVCRTAIAAVGRFRTVAARQVLEHLSDLGNFFVCADILLEDDGLLFIDVPDIAPFLETGDISFVWEEHVNYFTEALLQDILSAHDYRAVALKRYNYSGGILAVAARKQKRAPVAPMQADTLRAQVIGFMERSRQHADLLRHNLARLRARWKIVLYGVGCRACTLINAHDLGACIDFAVDDQAQRQGKYLPGSRLPIRSADALCTANAPTICLLAVNQEHNERVRQRLRNDTGQRVEWVSLHSPDDILAEARRLETIA